MTTDLYTFTIYDHPLDFPNDFVVRRWTIRPGTDPTGDSKVWHTGGTLDGARDSIPAGLYCLGRHPADDPTIVETWV